MSDTPDSRPALTGLSAVKLALMAQQVRAQSEAVLRADPIAIVGMGCRFPGGADSPEQFWQLLVQGVDAVREVPADRWDADAVYDADASVPGKAATKWGGFLDCIDGFDAAYFNILPREAERMDPQQRLFLEVAFEALDDAGQTREQLRGSRTGVFIASYHNDYQVLSYKDPDNIDARTLTGTVHSVLANRLSFLLDLRGPSISVDTACSSSLVAIHMACQSLRHGESDLVLAGGVSVMVTPDLMVSLSKVGFMAPDGRCKTFDDSADGFGRGEGCGVIVMKRLSDALADGDRVLAVVRGSAVNQDGHSTVLAAPNGLAQQALIREALQSAQLAPERISYVEAHGTGTPLGDPIEVEAIAATLGQPKPGAGTCFMGAAKANIGHMEAAAGVGGVIKTVLSLRHEAIPKQVHFKSLNKHITLDGTRLAVPTELTPWRRGALTRCAGTSGFGVGGTNAHVILEEAPQFIDDDAPPGDEVLRLLCLSAQSEAALQAMARQWVDFLPSSASALSDLCFTANARRSWLDQRLALVGRTREDFVARLGEYLRGEQSAAVVSGRVSATGVPRVAFVFSGQGPQWFAMGRELIAQEPAFKAVLQECDALMRPIAGWSLMAELAASESESKLHQTEYAQPALFAIQVGLASLWSAWGIRPDAVVGHSVGEIAALHVAGALSLANAVRVVVQRGRVMQQATGTGRMAAVGLTAPEGEQLVQPFGERLTVGAINGPRSIVLSGEPVALEQALAQLAAKGVQHRMLPVNYAFHSAQMAPFQQALAEKLADLVSSTPLVPVYSTVTGGHDAALRFDAAYFGRNVREPVRLHEAITALSDDGYDAFLEIGPHPVLAGSVAESLAARDRSGLIVASLRRGRPERETMLQAAAALRVAGLAVDGEAVSGGSAAVVDLPRYPWQRQRHWLRPTPLASGAVIALPGAHPLLGRRVSTAATRDRVYEARWEHGGAGALQDHRIGGRVLMPAAAMLEALQAGLTASVAAGGAPLHLESFAVERPFFLPEAGEPAAVWQLVVRDEPEGLRLEMHQAVSTSGEGDVEWQLLCTAAARASGPAALDTDKTDVSNANAWSREDFYSRMNQIGASFGPVFRSVHELRRGDGWARAVLRLPAEAAALAAPFGLHPALLDGALQLCVVAASPDGQSVGLWVPMGVDRFDMLRTGATDLRATAVLRGNANSGTLIADLRIEDERGALVALISGARFAKADAGAFARPNAGDGWVYELTWQPGPPLAASDVQADGEWLLLGDESALVAQLNDALRSRGGRCRVVPIEHVDAWRTTLAEQRAGGALRGVVHFGSASAVGFDPDAAAEARASGALLHLVQLLAGSDSGGTPPAPLWLVTRGAQAVTSGESPRSAAAAGAWGFAGVVAVEHPELPLRMVDLDAAAPDVDALVSELLSPSVNRVALRFGQRLLPRLVRQAAAVVPRVAENQAPQKLVASRAGTLDGLRVVTVPGKALQPNEVRIRVAAAGLNFRDVLVALGVYPGEGAPIGVECAGAVSELGAGVDDLRVGDRVLAFAPDSMGTEAVVPAAFVARLPKNLSMEQGAALPAAFLTAHLGLNSIAQLQRGHKVLIHAAAGGVGQAAVQLALRAGAEVFATAGSPEKRAYLLSQGVAHVMDSRSTAFAEEVLRLTGGRGVQVVLNSLAGEFIPAGLSVVAPGGWFLELGKREVWAPQAVAQRYPGIHYRVYDLGEEAFADPKWLRSMLVDVLSGFQDGSLKPLPLTAFDFAHAQDAFRFMAQARHIGKIVLNLPVAVEAPLVTADTSYLLTGGLGAMGLHAARWLVGQGARHLVLLGRRGPTQVAARAIADLQAGGVSVKVVAADVADEAAMRQVFTMIAADMPPLRGVVHAAGSVDDGIVLRQDWPRCAAVMRGKAGGALVLHRLTQNMPLDFFVLCSSAAGLLGSPGQSAYVAANAELDALALARRSQGLPATSVAWGSWAQGGMASELAGSGSDPWQERGLTPMAPERALAQLGELLRSRVTLAAVMDMDWARFFKRLPAGFSADYFQALAPRMLRDGEALAAPAVDALARIRALPATQRAAALSAHLTERALQVLGLSSSTPVDDKLPLKDIGLDSLMAVELRNALNRSTGKALSATLLFDYPTIAALTAHLMRLLGLEEVAAPVAAPKNHGLDELSDEEAEALLLQELGQVPGSSPRLETP